MLAVRSKHRMCVYSAFLACRLAAIFSFLSRLQCAVAGCLNSLNAWIAFHLKSSHNPWHFSTSVVGSLWPVQGQYRQQSPQQGYRSRGRRGRRAVCEWTKERRAHDFLYNCTAIWLIYITSIQWTLRHEEPTYWLMYWFIFQELCAFLLNY